MCICDEFCQLYKNSTITITNHNKTFIVYRANVYRIIFSSDKYDTKVNIVNLKIVLFMESMI